MTGLVSAFVLTAGLVADATGGLLVAGDRAVAFETVSIDTRTLAPGALFVAIAGERFDGHRFVGAATTRGAAGLLVSSAPEAAGDAAVILVPDTLVALQALGRAVRRQAGSRVVAITGSAGKTTTKELTAEVLSARYRVFRNRGNFNNHIGLPLSLTELHDGPDIAVVELGMNHAGEIRQLVQLAEPDVRVWINVGDAHIGFFDSVEAIARAKAEILEQATADAVAVINGDDPLVASHAASFAGRVIRFGERPESDVRATRVIDRGLDGTEADVETDAGPLHLRVPLPGRGQLTNALAAVAVARHFDVAGPDIEARIAQQQPVSRRGGTVTVAGGARLVDDSYNASPTAVRMMLTALGATPTRGRRIAALGEMLELGDESVRLHRDCGRAAAAVGLDLLVAVGGPGAEALAAGAVEAGMPAARVRHYRDSLEASADGPAWVGEGDIILVKGSRGTRMDLLADRLRGDA